MASQVAPILIGVTGTIGSGKSTVGKILAELGIPVIDSDLLVHELLSSDNPTQKAVIERFGDKILDPEKTVSGKPSIDRKQLGAIVFKDARARKDLEAILHPAVILECRKRVQQLKERKIVAVLVPLLFEAGLQNEYDQIWSIYTRDPVLRERLKSRDRLSDESVEERLCAQWSQDKKASLAHSVVDNSGSPEATRKQITLLLGKLETGVSLK